MNDHDLPTTDAEWRARLDPQQYAVCRCSATEPPFTGKYWDHKAAGVYTCAACAAPLFASSDGKRSGEPSTGDAFHGNVSSMKFHAPGCKVYHCKNCTASFPSRNSGTSKR